MTSLVLKVAPVLTRKEPSQKNLTHVFMHLTNYSLNVHSGNFVHSDSQNTGSKRTLSSVLYRLAAKGVDIKKVWSDIIALVIKTAIAVVPELKVYYHADIPPGKPGPTCFQVSGGRELKTAALLCGSEKADCWQERVLQPLPVH